MVILDLIRANFLLTLLYLLSGSISLILGSLLLKYYINKKKLVAKYLGLSIIFIGFAIISYLYSFYYYSITRFITNQLIRLISVSNLLIAIGLYFLIIYLHLAIYKIISNLVKIIYAIPILLMIYFIVLNNDMDILRLYLGYAFLPVILLLLLYVLLFMRHSMKIFLNKKFLPELRFGALMHITAMATAILAIVFQVIGKIYHFPLFSQTAILSLMLAFLSLTLLYMPTALPSWYIKISKKIMSNE